MNNFWLGFEKRAATKAPEDALDQWLKEESLVKSVIRENEGKRQREMSRIEPREMSL